MCNFYIMYYTPFGNTLPSRTCAGNNIPQLLATIPADSDLELPPNPALEAVAHGHHGHMGHPQGHDGPSTLPTTKTSTTITASTVTPQPQPGKNDDLYQFKAIQDNEDEGYVGPKRNRYHIQNVYPREYHPGYDYYDNVETMRNRKRYHPSSYDYYDDNNSDMDGYFGDGDNMGRPVSSRSHKLYNPRKSNQDQPYKETADGFGYYNNDAHRISGKKGAHYRPSDGRGNYPTTRHPNLSKTFTHRKSRC